MTLLDRKRTQSSLLFYVSPQSCAVRYTIMSVTEQSSTRARRLRACVRSVRRRLCDKQAVNCMVKFPFKVTKPLSSCEKATDSTSS